MLDYSYDMSKRFFWRVGDDIFYNKFDALNQSIKTNAPLKFHMFEEAFDTYDWTKEPEETWDEILRQRAQQIRDSYSYIRLWYSGGADSHTILRTFMKNNIPLDEIIMMRHSPFDDFTTLADTEINDVAFSFIRTMRPELGNTKIHILDIGHKEYDEYSKRDFYATGCFNFKPISFREIYGLMPKELELKGDSHCEIRGYEKPRLFMEGNLFYSTMYDSTNGHYAIGDYRLESFYTTEAMPKVHIKQSHLLKNHLKRQYKVTCAKDLERIDRENYDLKPHINNSCRYPLWKEITLGKGGSDGPPPKEEIILNDDRMKNSIIRSRYFSMMNEIDHSPLKEHCNNNNVFKNFKGILSKKYCLGS